MLARYDLSRLRTRRQLALALGTNEQMLEFVLAFQPPPDPVPKAGTEGALVFWIPAFLQHKIPKRNKSRGIRLAWEPTLLKAEYKKLGRYLGKFFHYKLDQFPHSATFGYVGGRNIKGNAQAHCGHKHLLVVDIEAFFPSITRTRVEALFLECGFSDEMAELLGRLLTIEDALPLGLPTSPVISNAIFLQADRDLTKLAQCYEATYTRYSDDLSFSGDGALPEVGEVAAILENYGFRLAASKMRRSRRGQAHFVTGLSISEPDQPHAPRKKKRRLRQELYYAQKFGLRDHLARMGVNDERVVQEQINRLDGTVKFIAHHEPALALRLRPQWTHVLQEAMAKPSYAPRNQSGVPFYIAIDEAEYAPPSGKVLALGLSVSQHPDRLLSMANDVLQDTLSDLWAAGDQAAIEKRGLHFNDATPDLRLRYVEALQIMPFEGYVVMGPLNTFSDYEATYLRLLQAVIKRRLMAAESQFVQFVIEKNSKVSELKVRSLIQNAVNELKLEKNRGPRFAHVEFVAKPNLGVSVPDFLLGILGDYLKSKSAAPGRPEPRDRLLFERLRDKYRLILDVEPWTEYSRRRPILPWEAGVAPLETR
jgi:hypothetical protein